jgi:hypothetical protein
MCEGGVGQEVGVERLLLLLGCAFAQGRDDAADFLDCRFVSEYDDSGGIILVEGVSLPGCSMVSECVLDLVVTQVAVQRCFRVVS